MRWNSTFDMLNYALEHREAVDGITGDREWGLRPYELDQTEWEMLDELRNVLKLRWIVAWTERTSEED
jgi:hypothetical protein